MRQWRRRDLRGLRGDARWRGGGLRTRNVGKRGLCNTGQKRNGKKRKKKHIFPYVPANEAMVAARLARLEGRGMVERWGFEDPACGKRGLSNGQKRNEKKHNFTCVPASAGNGGGGCGG